MGAVMYNNFATVVHLIYIYFEIDIINILDFQNNTILFIKIRPMVYKIIKRDFKMNNFKCII